MIFFISFYLSCNLLNRVKNEGFPLFLAVLGLNGSQSASADIPKYRLDAYLKSLSDQPLKRYYLKFNEISYLTNDTGAFSLYLNPGSYTINVMDVTENQIGSFQFNFVDNTNLPEITYSENAAFKISWRLITALPQNTIDPNAGNATLTINELAPGISTSAGGDYIEFFVKGGGNLTGVSVCVRTTCAYFPEVKVNSGDYVIFHEGDGTNDASALDGLNANAWDFYGLPSMSTTDSLVYTSRIGNSFQSVINYANSDGNWTGCGSSGNTTCLSAIINAKQWTIAGESYDESDSVIPPSSKSFGSSDTIFRCPNGSSLNQKSYYIYSSNSSERTIGSPNTNCPGFNLLSATSVSSTSVQLLFSADPTIGGTNVSNYSIYQGLSCSGTSLNVNAVSQSNATITLTTASQTQGMNYTVCITDVLGGVENFSLGQNSINFSGYAPTAQLTLNEIAPAMANGTDYVEIYVISGGSTQGLSLCNRTTCSTIPSRIVSSGEYIIFYASAGENDTAITSGLDANFWEFYGAPNMETTDSVVYIGYGDTASPTIVSAIAYTNGDGSWTGSTSINQVVAQGKWPQAGGTWAESDAIKKSPVSNFGSNDTLIKIPNGTGTDNLSVWQVVTSISQRTIGSANSAPITPPTINAGDIVFNELRRISNGHFLELYNNTGASLDLASATVYFYRAATCNTDFTSISWTNKFLLSGVLSANGYYLVTSNSLGLSENQVTSFSFGSNGCAVLTKSSVSPSSINDASIIDIVGWGTSPVCKGTCATDLADKGVLRRTSVFEAITTGNNNNEFSFSANCAGTPKAVNTSSGGCVTQASTPSYSPVAGYYATTQSVTISSTNADQIRYTVDGSTPTCYGTGYQIVGSSGTYSVTNNLTLKAIGCAAGVASTLFSGDYQIGGTPPPSLNIGDVVINEIRRQSTGSAHWIELYNRTASAIDFASVNAHFHRISSCNSSWTSNTINTVQLTGIIQANGYYLLSQSSPGPAGTDQVGSFSSLTDNNCVFLTTSASRPNSISDSTIVDIVGYGTASAYGGSGTASNLTNGSVLHRIPNGNSTLNNSAAFTLLSSCEGTPRSANSGSCPDTTAPQVSVVSPSDTATGVATSAAISITFNEPMNGSSITTNTTDTTCSGTIQVSESSSFTTCVQMASLSVSTNTYTITPNSSLTSTQTYFVKVLTTVKDSSGNFLASAFSSTFTTGSGTPASLITNGSFESDNNSCQQSASPSGCPNSWSYKTGTGSSTLSAIAGTTPTGGGNNYGTLSSWTSAYSGREIRTNCFSLDKTKDISLQGYFLKDSTNSTQIRFLIYYFTDSSCTSAATTTSKTFSGQTISAQNTWEQKTSSELKANYPVDSTLYIQVAIQGQRTSSGGINFDLVQATQP